MTLHSKRQKLREIWKRQQRCLDCGKPVVVHRTRCVDHLKRQRETQRKCTKHAVERLLQKDRLAAIKLVCKNRQYYAMHVHEALCPTNEEIQSVCVLGDDEMPEPSFPIEDSFFDDPRQEVLLRGAAFHRLRL